MRDWLERHEIAITTIIAVIIGLVVLFDIIKYESNFTYSTEPMIIEITDKKHWTTQQPMKVGKITTIRTVDHYAICSDNHEMSVDYKVYEGTNIGDRIFIDCTYVYDKRDKTLVKVVYNYKN